MFKLTGKANELFERLMQIPPDLASIEESLKAGEYSAEEISMVAAEYSGYCMIEVEFDDDGNYVDKEIAKLLPGEVLENHVSRYLIRCCFSADSIRPGSQCGLWRQV